MRQVFKVEEGVVVPDGTVVHPIIGPRQMTEAGIGMFEEMSLALGHLPPNTISDIHIHPFCNHLTWVLSGSLTVKMKDPSFPDPYELTFDERELVLTRAGTYFQLINNSDTLVETLYGCGPAFVFELNENGDITYNDQIVPGKTWEELAEMKWQLEEMQDLEELRRERNAAIKRMINSQQTAV